MSEDKSIARAKEDEAVRAELKSDVIPKAPESGSDEANAVRGQIIELAGLKNRPTLLDALAECNNIENGDNRGADLLSHKYGSKALKYVKRIPTDMDGGAGWHCEGREDGPLSPEESAQLAEVINSLIDLRKMKENAEKNREEREVMEGMIVVISELTEPDDLKKLRNIAIDANRMGLVHKTETGVAPIRNLKGSHELAQAINSKKKELADKADAKENEIREKQRTERRVEGFKRVIETLTDEDKKFEIYVYQILERETGFLKKRTLKKEDWTVEAIEGVYGSKQLVEIVLARKEALKKLREAKADAKKKEVDDKRKRAIATLGDQYKIVKR